MPANEPADPTTGTDRTRTGPPDRSTRGGDRYMSPDDVADVYADLADTYARMAFLDRLFAGRYRRRQFGDVEGRVLDVACGTGSNFRYLPDSVDLVGIDVSPAMLAKARDELAALPLSGELHEMDAQALAFEDAGFDAVISSLSTCTFPDPEAALGEMARVCKPDGEIRLLEHGRSGVGPIDRFLDWRADAHYRKHGCRWNQEPVDLVRAAGLDVRETNEAMLGMLTRIVARPR